MIIAIRNHDASEREELKSQMGIIYFYQHPESGSIPESPTRETLRNYLETCSPKTQRKYSHYRMM